MKILFATSELTPLAKVGGLGDVAGALPPALSLLGQDIRVIIPKYNVIDDKKYSFELIAKNIDVAFGKVKEKINLYETAIPGTKTPVILIDNPKYLGSGGIYFEKSAFVGSFKEIERFLFFSEAIIEVPRAMGWQPDIIHCQDWHTGILPLLIKIKKPKFKTIFTIHNLANQGKWRAEKIFSFLGLSGREHPNLRKLTNRDLNLMEQGIMGADIINTVSQTYAKEILTKEYGEGLENTLLERKKDLYGIINGIDINRFNPATDKEIKTKYNINSLKRKGENKIDLQKTVNLPKKEKAPLFGLVSRLTDQKGIDLTSEIIDELVKFDLQIVFLGTGDPVLEKLLIEKQKKYPNKIFVKIGFDAKLAQKIYAGADIFLMPSRFEPCGLGQMIAMRYGTVPVVHATGGLKDTVENFNYQNKTGDGFVFNNYKSEELLKTITIALKAFEDKKTWKKLMTNGMKKDFSWKNSAKKYFELYKKALSKK